ncbi:MAG: hypothetical protein ACT6FD_03405 [Methanosarcinaceae archaeon]
MPDGCVRLCQKGVLELKEDGACNLNVHVTRPENSIDYGRCVK